MMREWPTSLSCDGGRPANRFTTAAPGPILDDGAPVEVVVSAPEGLVVPVDGEIGVGGVGDRSTLMTSAAPVTRVTAATAATTRRAKEKVGGVATALPVNPARRHYVHPLSIRSRR